MDTKKDFNQQFNTCFSLGENEFEHERQESMELVWQWHIEEMRELAESFRMKEREGFDTDKMTCDICGDYDDCDCSGYNEAIDEINQSIEEALK